jgi:predicted DCC family thiol-disulfide oxidoreductase YuxK
MPDNRKSTGKTTMFYDGGCPICRREVGHYQRLYQECLVQWVDISCEQDALHQYGLNYNTAMSRLHVLDQEGNLLQGAKAFVALWKVLPYYRWLAGMVQVLHLVSFLDWGYQHFAEWRLKRRENKTCCIPGNKGTTCKKEVTSETDNQ